MSRYKEGEIPKKVGLVQIILGSVCALGIVGVGFAVGRYVIETGGGHSRPGITFATDATPVPPPGSGGPTVTPDSGQTNQNNMPAGSGGSGTQSGGGNLATHTPTPTKTPTPTPNPSESGQGPTQNPARSTGIRFEIRDLPTTVTQGVPFNLTVVALEAAVVAQEYATLVRVNVRRSGQLGPFQVLADDLLLQNGKGNFKSCCRFTEAGEWELVAEDQLDANTLSAQVNLTVTHAESDVAENAAAIETFLSAYPSLSGVQTLFNATAPLRNDPTAQTISRLVAQPLAQTAVVATLAAVIVSFGSSLPVSGQALLSTLLLGGVVGLSKRTRQHNYTLIYHALTKRPIAGATIRVFDTTHRLIQTKVTDIWGRVRLFLPHGRYFLDIQKEHFRFPSTIIQGNTDGPYTEIYSGGAYLVRTAHPALIGLSIPLDPLSAVGERSHQGHWMARLTRWVDTVGIRYELPVLLLGFFLALFAVIVRPTPLNGIFVLVYPIIFVVRTILRKTIVRTFGTLKDVSGQPLGEAIIQLFSEQGHKLLESQQTDTQGRFSFLVPPGVYRIRVLNEDYSFPVKKTALPIGALAYTGGTIHVSGRTDQYLVLDVLVAPKNYRSRSVLSSE